MQNCVKCVIIFVYGIIISLKIFYDEEIAYNFIQNPFYYDNPSAKNANIKSLVDKLKSAINKADNPIVDYILTGEKHEKLDAYIESIKQYPIYEKYSHFLNQRVEYDIKQMQQQDDNKQKNNEDMVK